MLPLLRSILSGLARAACILPSTEPGEPAIGGDYFQAAGDRLRAAMEELG